MRRQKLTVEFVRWLLLVDGNATRGTLRISLQPNLQARLAEHVMVAACYRLLHLHVHHTEATLPLGANLVLQWLVFSRDQTRHRVLVISDNKVNPPPSPNRRSSLRLK